MLVDEDSGLGGRRLWSLGKRSRAPLPWTTLDVGSPVVLSREAKRPGEPMRGVVFRRDESTIGVAMAESGKGGQEHFAGTARRVLRTKCS